MNNYYILLAIAALLSIWAQMKVKSTFAKYSRVQSSKGVTGARAASILMSANGITNVAIRAVRGYLTDNYNPSNKTLNLSESVHSSTSIAAVGVAAHETGHAIQDKVGYAPLVLRSTLVPVANIGSQAGPTLAVLGLLAGVPILLELGIILFSGAVAFYLITLPVEFNASFRALRILKETGTLNDEELKGVREVLTAAAMTYVASALTAVANLLRLLAMRDRRRR